MRPNLLSWQWEFYARNHMERGNLVRHILSWPFFPGGLAIASAGVATGTWWLVPLGLLCLPLVMAVQGRGHKLEAEPPIPFEGPSDVVSRILVEQLITFPRYLLTGGFGRAWKNGD